VSCRSSQEERDLVDELERNGTPESSQSKRKILNSQEEKARLSGIVQEKSKDGQGANQQPSISASQNRMQRESELAEIDAAMEQMIAEGQDLNDVDEEEEDKSQSPTQPVMLSQTMHLLQDEDALNE
jgi:hypothetical protein